MSLCQGSTKPKVALNLTLRKLAGRGLATRVPGPSDWIEPLHWVGWVGLGFRLGGVSPRKLCGDGRG